MSKDQFDTSEIVEVIGGANDLANDLNHQYVTLEHLLYVTLSRSEIASTLQAIGGDVQQIMDDTMRFLQGPAVPQRRTDLSAGGPRHTETMKEIVQACVAHGRFSGGTKAKSIDLIVAILQRSDPSDSYACAFLVNHGVSLDTLKRYLAHGSSSSRGGQPAGQGQGDGKDITSKEEAIDYLARFTTNLNETAAQGTIDPLIGRTKEVDTIIRVSARRTKNNVVMVGEPGVGKTAIAEGFALKISRGEVPEALKNAVIYSLDVGRLIAGTKFRGDFEERMSLILKALTFIEQPILFIDEIHMIMGAGAGSNQGGMDVANLLKPALQKGALRCIGSTTHEEFRKHFEKDRALLRRFQSLSINEPSIEDAKLILRGLRKTYEDYHGITITDEAIDAAVELTSRYINNRQLPDKAIDVIDGAGARQKVAPEAERKTTITAEMIEQEVAAVANIPAKTVASDEKAKLKQLDADLHRVVFGQDEALNTLTDAVYISRAGLRDDNKPAGVFLFVGPTGVGKTEAVKQLAATMGVPMVRFNMSEYMEKHSVSKLIGSPPGYVGHGEGGAGSGLLINEIDTKPHCVLLLDEFEKAHSDIYNLFLQVFDEGKLTSSNGKEVIFKNVLIVMTSNVGARREAQAALGFTKNSREGEGEIDMKNAFAPEFLNRIDAIVRFHSLKRENMEMIVDKFVGELGKQAARSNVTLELTAAARTWLADKGYDPAMGARPLARVIQDTVKKPLSRAMLFNMTPAGGHVVVDLIGDRIELVVQSKEAEATPEVV